MYVEFYRTTILRHSEVKSKLRPLPGLREDEHDRHYEEHRVDAAAAAAATASVVLSSAVIVVVADARVGVVGVLSFIRFSIIANQEECEFYTLLRVLCTGRFASLWYRDIRRGWRGIKPCGHFSVVGCR